MMVKIVRIVIAALLVAAGVGAFAQQGAITVGRNLAELTAQARTIVRGQVVSAVVEPHAEFKNLKTLVVTLRVDHALKGTTGSNVLTFRQFVWDYHDIHSAGGYRKGQQVLLLLNAPTPLGLTSTAGLGQGRFQITRGRDGVDYAVNERGNADLMRGVSTAVKASGVRLPADLDVLVQRAPSGPMRVDQLETLISKMSQGK